MTKNAALQFALSAAALLHRGARQVGSTSVGNQTLMGTLSVTMAAQAQDVAALDPSIRELILFGSTARGEENPHDIDLMMFDGGFYSNSLAAPRDVYWEVRENFQYLLTGWFGINEGHPEALPPNVRVDLLVLPEQIFTNTRRLQEIARRQSDPWFFENAFSKMLRFDVSANQFVETNLAYFEQKHGVNLSYLRTAAERQSEEAKALLAMPGCHV